MWKKINPSYNSYSFFKKIFPNSSIAINENNDSFNIQIDNIVYDNNHPVIEFNWGNIDLVKLEHFLSVIYGEYTDFLYSETIYYETDDIFYQFILNYFNNSNENEIIIHCDDQRTFNDIMNPIREEIEKAKNVRIKYEEYHSLPHLIKRLEHLDDETIKTISQYTDQFCKD